MKLELSILTLALAVTASGIHCSTKKAAAEAGPPASAQPDVKKTVKFDINALDRLGIKVELSGQAAGSVNLEVPGSLEYNLERYAEVGTLVDGRVTTLNVKAGDRVKKGQALATIVVPSIATAQAEYLSADAASRIAKENLTRETSLLEKNLTTAREAELAKGEAARTEAELAAAKAKLDALGVNRPTGGANISGAGTLVLHAPLEGVVVRRDAVLGRFLQAKETAFVIADPSDLRASINVYEADLPYFRIGEDATITIDAMPGKVVRGKIVLVEPQVGKSSRAARAFIDVPNEDGALRPGLFIRASISLPEIATQGKLIVPASAVQPLGDGDVVFVELQPGLFEVRKVTVARRTTQVAEIREGLSRGERLVVEGGFVLRGEVTKQ